MERYLTDQYDFDRYRAIKGSAAGWDAAVWRELADLGVLGINVPPAHGGLGFGPLETLAMMGACGSSLLIEPLIDSAVIGTAVLRAFPTMPRRMRCCRACRPVTRLRYSLISRAMRASNPSG